MLQSGCPSVPRARASTDRHLYPQPADAGTTFRAGEPVETTQRVNRAACCSQPGFEGPDGAGLAVLPLLKSRGMMGGEATVSVCDQLVCKGPGSCGRSGSSGRAVQGPLAGSVPCECRPACLRWFEPLTHSAIEGR